LAESHLSAWFEAFRIRYLLSPASKAEMENFDIEEARNMVDHLAHIRKLQRLRRERLEEEITVARFGILKEFREHFPELTGKFSSVDDIRSFLETQTNLPRQKADSQNRIRHKFSLMEKNIRKLERLKKTKIPDEDSAVPGFKKLIAEAEISKNYTFVSHFHPAHAISHLDKEVKENVGMCRELSWRRMEERRRSWRMEERKRSWRRMEESRGQEEKGAG
jgi:hypothetical protein